jgi:hypothetical protein
MQPMGGPMQPMGGPPMQPMGQMGQMGPMGMRQPMRQGTSKMVPIVVSAGLAVGVFCGLLFGLGTDKHVSADPARVSNGVKRTDDIPDVPTLSTNTVKPLPPPPPRAGSNTGSAVAAAGSGSAGSAAPTIKSVKLTIEIKPDSAAPAAKIAVDGKPITGTAVDVALDPGATQKRVHVQVQAPGFRDGTRDLDVLGSDSETSVTFELEPTRGRAGGTGGGAPSGGTPSGESAGTPSGGTPSGGTPSGGAPSGGAPSGGSKGTGGKGTGGKGKGSGKTGLIDI